MQQLGTPDTARAGNGAKPSVSAGTNHAESGGPGFPGEVTAETLFGALPCAMVLIDRHATILSMTRRGEQLISDSRVFAGRDGPQELRLRDPYHQRRLSEAINRITLESVGVPTHELTVTDVSGADTVALALAPVDNTMIVVCMDACVRRPLPDLIILQQAFGLTPAEARVARHIGEGLRLNEIADRLDASVHTVRLHCKRVLHKTGASRQAELVRVILDLGSLPERN